MVRGSGQKPSPSELGRTGLSPGRVRRHPPWTHLLTGILSALTLLPGIAGADLRMSASPMKLHLALEPGTSRTKAVEILNGGEKAIRVLTSVSGWTTTRDGEMVFDPPEPVERAVPSWIHPDLHEFTLPPHGRRIVRITTSMPDSARGSYWAVVFFQGETADNHAGFGLDTKVRIGTTFYLSALGTEVRKDELTGMQVLPGPDEGALTLTVSLANRGNVYHYPAGWLQVVDSRGERLLEEAVPYRVLLPGMETVYRQVWVPSSPGAYQFVATFDLGSEALLQGVKEIVIPEVSPGAPAITEKHAQSGTITEPESP